MSFSDDKKILISFKIKLPLLYSLIYINDKLLASSLIVSPDTRESAIVYFASSSYKEG